MTTRRQSLFTRDDTFFGVCEALGEDLGFNAQILRVTLALLLFWNPVAVLAGYAALGVLVLFTRLVAPNPRPAAEPAAVEPSEPELAEGEVQVEPERLPIAA